MPSFGPRSRTRAALALAALAVASVACGQVTWEKSFASAIKKATASRKPIFVDFSAEWCGPCKMLEGVFQEAKVQSLLRNATCLRIDVDENQADAARFKVSGIPRLLLLSPDGKKVLWDAVGYRDADMLSEELGEAMHMKASDGHALVSAAPVPVALTKVQAALNKGSFGSLKASDPATAQKGLQLMVLQLGVFKESDFQPVASLLLKAGRDALPALVEGMGHKTLAVRVGAAKLVQKTLSPEELKGLPFDPWAPGPTRASQLNAWRRFLHTR